LRITEIFLKHIALFLRHPAGVVVPVKGFDRRVCPTTGLVADLVMWLPKAEWTDVIASRDAFPYFWKGIFMKNGTEYDTGTRPLFEARGW
jgi:hypothetical protein